MNAFLRPAFFFCTILEPFYGRVLWYFPCSLILLLSYYYYFFLPWLPISRTWKTIVNSTACLLSLFSSVQKSGCKKLPLNFPASFLFSSKTTEKTQKKRYYHCNILYPRKYPIFNLQCISNLTEVEAGTEMLLLVAWQVKMECKSSLLSPTSLSSLVTFPSSMYSLTSSRRAWSRHQVTRAVGRPKNKR